ncbi:MAG: maleylacetoacetate isomerase [Gammaproteobacteria bacterium]|nr:maleylacetoacetate isomerase [Gammaproteobacteria bacterium]
MKNTEQVALTLYDYHRSSAAYRVRIALNLKGFEYQSKEVNLLESEEFSAEYKAINPQGLVPALLIQESGKSDVVLTQSLAICEYLQELRPEPSIMAESAFGRARIRSLAQLISSDIHPLDNLRVLNYLEDELSVDKEAIMTWYQYWIKVGFEALERRLQESDTGDYCHQDQVSLADICLVPQVYNAKRFGCDLSTYPKIVEISGRCNQHLAFVGAQPENM